MDTSIKEALNILAKEKNIDKDAMLSAIQVAIENACRSYYHRYYSDVPIDLQVTMNKDTCEYNIFLGKEVIPDDENIITDLTEIHFSEAKKYDKDCEIGDIVYIYIPSIDFGNSITQNAMGIIKQKLREQEKNSVYLEYKNKENTIQNGSIRKIFKEGYSVNLGSVDATMSNQSVIPGEKFNLDEKILVYIDKVEEGTKGPKVSVCRNNVDFVSKLFEREVQEIRDGIVEIKAISRDAGIRTKLSVISNDPNIEPVGACLGVNSLRVNAIVAELNGEKIDVIHYDEDISNYIENAISPAVSVASAIDEEQKLALIIVPDTQLSLAIGKDGQNARLAARLTGYKIDIKSESQAIESGLADELGLEYDHSKYDFSKREKEENEESNEDSNDIEDDEKLEGIDEEIKIVEDEEE